MTIHMSITIRFQSHFHGLTVKVALTMTVKNSRKESGCQTKKADPFFCYQFRVL